MIEPVINLGQLTEAKLTEERSTPRKYVLVRIRRTEVIHELNWERTRAAHLGSYDTAVYNTEHHNLTIHAVKGKRWSYTCRGRGGP
jgi:hypothetical protein